MILQYMQDEGYTASVMTIQDEANVKLVEQKSQRTQLKRMHNAILGRAAARRTSNSILRHSSHRQQASSCTKRRHPSHPPRRRPFFLQRVIGLRLRKSPPRRFRRTTRAFCMQCTDSRHACLRPKTVVAFGARRVQMCYVCLVPGAHRGGRVSEGFHASDQAAQAARSMCTIARRI